MAPTVDAPVAPTPEKTSLLEDFIDIYVTPSKVFERRATSGFFLVLLIVTVLIGVIVVATRGPMQGIVDAEVERQVAMVVQQNPSLTGEQAQGMRGVMEMSITYGVIVFIPIIILLLGLTIWLVGKLFGARFSFTAGAMIAAYAYTPRILESVLVAVQGLLLDTATMRGRFQLSFGVGRFLDPDTTSMGLLGILGRVDLITIWITILVGIGISVVGKVPRSQGMLAAALIWVLGALPAVWQLATG